MQAQSIALRTAHPSQFGCDVGHKSCRANPPSQWLSIALKQPELRQTAKILGTSTQQSHCYDTPWLENYQED